MSEHANLYLLPYPGSNIDHYGNISTEGPQLCILILAKIWETWDSVYKQYKKFISIGFFLQETIINVLIGRVLRDTLNEHLQI